MNRLVGLFVLITTLLTGSVALAHGGVVSQGSGSVTLNPRAPVAGKPVTVTVHPTADDGHPLTGGKVTATFTNSGDKEKVSAPFTEAEPGLYTANVTLGPKDWHGALIYEDGASSRITADFGFTVFTKPGETFGVLEIHKLDWRQAGVTQAPDWTDTATWVILVAGPMLAALALWYKGREGLIEPGALQGRSLIPPGLLTLAMIAAIIMPLSGFWDITWHADQGRDGLLSPPHLGIYSGILIMLAATLMGIRASGGIRRIKEFPALGFTIIAMIIQLASAPVDEFWHRMMGLDVSIWAPPHDMLIFGAAFAVLGLAMIQATADPEGKSAAARYRMLGFGVATLMILNAFLMEFEIRGGTQSWHVSQLRSRGLYPMLFSLALAASVIPVARLTRVRFAATQMAVAFWLIRAAEIRFFLPAMGRTAPNYPPLAVIVGALAVDLVLEARVLKGRYRYAAAGAAGALGLFAGYALLAGVLPVRAISLDQLLLWAPLGVVVSTAMGYVGGWMGDYTFTRALASTPGANKAM